MRHQFSLHRVHMHVFQLFCQLPASPHVEIVEAPLPEMLFRGMVAVQPFCVQGPRNALFQYLQDFRRIAFPWFGDEKMNVFRHDDISDQAERIFNTDFCQDADEAIAGLRRSEQGAPSGTTEGNEVEITLPVAALQRVAHVRKPAPLKTARVRHPPLQQYRYYTNITPVPPKTWFVEYLFLGFCTGRIDAEIPDVGVDVFAGHFYEGVFARF